MFELEPASTCCASATQVMQNAAAADRKRRQTVTRDDVTTLKVADGLAEWLNGKRDAVLRTSIAGQPGLAADRLLWPMSVEANTSRTARASNASRSSR